MSQILKAVADNAHLSSDAEITLEANPSSADGTKLRLDSGTVYDSDAWFNTCGNTAWMTLLP